MFRAFSPLSRSSPLFHKSPLLWPCVSVLTVRISYIPTNFRGVLLLARSSQTGRDIYKDGNLTMEGSGPSGFNISSILKGHEGGNGTDIPACGVFPTGGSKHSYGNLTMGAPFRNVSVGGEAHPEGNITSDGAKVGNYNSPRLPPCGNFTMGHSGQHAGNDSGSSLPRLGNITTSTDGNLATPAK